MKNAVALQDEIFNTCPYSSSKYMLSTYLQLSNMYSRLLEDAGVVCKLLQTGRRPLSVLPHSSALLLAAFLVIKPKFTAHQPYYPLYPSSSSSPHPLPHQPSYPLYPSSSSSPHPLPHQPYYPLYPSSSSSPHPLPHQTYYHIVSSSFRARV